jgi:hypothetical protein
MDPKWFYRAGLVAVIIAFIVLFTRMSMMAMKPDTSRMDREVGAAVKGPQPSTPESP